MPKNKIQYQMCGIIGKLAKQKSICCKLFTNLLKHYILTNETDAEIISPVW